MSATKPPINKPRPPLLASAGVAPGEPATEETVGVGVEVEPLVATDGAALLIGALLIGALLTGALLTGARLTGALLTGALLGGASLIRAVDIATGAKLEGALPRAAPLLNGAVLSGAVDEDDEGAGVDTGGIEARTAFFLAACSAIARSEFGFFSMRLSCSCLGIGLGRVIARRKPTLCVRESRSCAAHAPCLGSALTGSMYLPCGSRTYQRKIWSLIGIFRPEENSSSVQ